MKTILILLVAICVYILLCSFYSAWAGHGLLYINAGFVATGLMLVALLVIFSFCIYHFIRKVRGEWRQWLLRTTILTIGWAATFCIVLIGSRLAMQSGRYFYWRTHKSELESIALNQLKRQQPDGFYYVPTNEVPQLGYPVFVDIDSSNSFQIVGFSHFSTTPRRRSGFIFLKEVNRLAVNALQTHTEGLTQLSTNWFEYGQYKTTAP